MGVEGDHSAGCCSDLNLKDEMILHARLTHLIESQLCGCTCQAPQAPVACLHPAAAVAACPCATAGTTPLTAGHRRGPGSLAHRCTTASHCMPVRPCSMYAGQSHCETEALSTAICMHDCCWVTALYFH